MTMQVELGIPEIMAGTGFDGGMAIVMIGRMVATGRARFDRGKMNGTAIRSTIGEMIGRVSIGTVDRSVPDRHIVMLTVGSLESDCQYRGVETMDLRGTILGMQEMVVVDLGTVVLRGIR